MLGAESQWQPGVSTPARLPGVLAGDQNPEDEAVLLRDLRNAIHEASYVVPVLVEFIGNPAKTPYLRRLAIEALECMDTEAVEGVKSLEAIISSDNVDDALAAQAIITLSAIAVRCDPVRKVAVSTISKSLARATSGKLLTRELIRAVGSFGFEARDSLDALVAIIAKPSTDLQGGSLAAKAVAAIAKDTNPGAKNFGPFELLGLERKLEQAERILIAGGPGRYRSELGALEEALAYLRQRKDFLPTMVAFQAIRSPVVLVIALYIVLLLAVALIKRCRRNWLLPISTWLSRLEIESPHWVKFPTVRVGGCVAYLLLLPPVPTKRTNRGKRNHTQTKEVSVQQIP